MDIEGNVKVIFPTQEFGSGFKKREFVLTTREQYPQDIKFEAVKERIELVNALKEGDSVKVHFNLRGNEYQGKYYVNLVAWRIEPAMQGAERASAREDVPLPEESAQPVADEIVEDDLPF